MGHGALLFLADEDCGDPNLRRAVGHDQTEQRFRAFVLSCKPIASTPSSPLPTETFPIP
jgi:hypothetical protein